MKSNRLSKKSILQACKVKQELTISDFEQELKNIRENLTNHDESASQSQKGSGDQNEMIVRLEHELTFLKKELQILESIDPEKEFQTVDEGAVVETDQRIFFVSTSIEQVDVNGKCVFGISTKAPIFQAMKGKKKGDSFEGGGIHYFIVDVY
ncbi:GreA/GreB family elongation factor [Algoriphagus limi]|uniref:GreA/GreB family elongation factor n=1 Tax=Algoriphagus limi TaxID=2975273 RepID=A0ABT2GCE2_9BACT|nr:GreA/GreB family elongation factor [Algoriphagus limi]MCS5491650.1 GreA/GreB family elongation factor [Algoriphagus limi]